MALHCGDGNLIVAITGEKVGQEKYGGENACSQLGVVLMALGLHCQGSCAFLQPGILLVFHFSRLSVGFSHPYFHPTCSQHAFYFMSVYALLTSSTGIFCITHLYSSSDNTKPHKVGELLGLAQSQYC